jgi:hypothetical protein
LDLSGFSLLDCFGIERKPLIGVHTAQSLTNCMVEEWVPYLECHQCGRGDYCKYRRPSRFRADRFEEIRCGVAVDVLSNFVKHTFDLLEGIPTEAIQGYLDGAYYLQRFVLESERITGSLIDQDMLKWYSHYVPMAFGNVISLREHLNKAAGCFQGLPWLRSLKGILLVEGPSEKAFLDKLKESHLASHLYLKVETYGGGGNRRAKRIQMLLDQYMSLGYVVYIQGDADGKYADIFDGLVIKGSVRAENTFVFQNDFESAIPLQILHMALKNLGALRKIDFQDFASAVSQKKGSIAVILKDAFDLDIVPLKVLIAEAVAEILNRGVWSSPVWAWWQDENFLLTELGKFVEFTGRIP